MTHFSVLVTGTDIEAQMKPFDENLETPRYLSRTKVQIIAEGRLDIERYRDGLYAEYLADPVAYTARRPNPAHLRYLKEEFPTHLTWTDEQVYADAIRWCDDLDAEGNEWSKANPRGYWDYWRVGGRWAGHLPLRNGRDGHMEPLSWEWGFDGSSSDKKPDPSTHADVALKGDVNLEALDSTFAILHEGEWVARGEMGWFGSLRDEQVSEEEWPAKWHQFVLALPADTLLTVVDCHV